MDETPLQNQGESYLGNLLAEHAFRTHKDGILLLVRLLVLLLTSFRRVGQGTTKGREAEDEGAVERVHAWGPRDRA